MEIGAVSGVRVLGAAVGGPRDVDPAAPRLDNAGAAAALGWTDPDARCARAAEWGVATREWLAVPGTDPGPHDVVDLAVAAAERALADAGLRAAEVDAWLVATSTPPRVSSSVAARVARRLGSTALALELRGGGAGALQAVAVACRLPARRAVVIAADALSPLLDPADPSALLYADGAAALVLGREASWPGGLLGARLGTAAVAGRPFTVPGRLPPPPGAAPGDYRFQAADRTYLEGLRGVWDHAADALRGRLPSEAWLAPYPVTRPLADHVAARLGVPWDRVAFPLAAQGCVGTAGVLSAWVAARAAAPDRPLGALAVGGGVTWGALAWAPGPPTGTAR